MLSISAWLGSIFVTTLALLQSIIGASSVWTIHPPSIGFFTKILSSGANLLFGDSIVRMRRLLSS